MTTAAEGSPKFTGFVEASGHATTWRMRSYRQAPNEVKWAELQTYSPGTLIANWNEDKYKISSMSKSVPLPSRFNHYYQTTYRGSFGRPSTKVPDILRFSSGMQSPGAFPAHQPILDTPKLKAYYNSYTTSSMEYGSSRIGPNLKPKVPENKRPETAANKRPETADKKRPKISEDYGPKKRMCRG